jgi:hypothetical protein
MQLRTENGLTNSEVMVTAGANQVRSSAGLFGLACVHSVILVAVYADAGLTLRASAFTDFFTPLCESSGPARGDSGHFFTNAVSRRTFG